MFTSKYKNIKLIYSLESIEEGYVCIRNKEGLQKQYIYEVVPISILNFSDEKIYNILNCYVEFLKGINTKFKVIVRNFKFNEEEYISKHVVNCSDKIKNLDIYDKYIQDLREKISSQSIYTSKIYICFICKGKDCKKEIEEGINKLRSVNLIIKSLSKNEIYNLMYESINKI